MYVEVYMCMYMGCLACVQVDCDLHVPKLFVTCMCPSCLHGSSFVISVFCVCFIVSVFFLSLIISVAREPAGILI